nr:MULTISPECIES: preprotein translocase subunit SecE [Asticcacaulis]
MVKKPDPKPAAKTPTVSTGKTPLGKIEPVKVAASAAAVEPKKPFNPAKFFTEVRQEARKITWTSRKETWITTVMVLLMVVLAGVFFFLVDGALGFLTQQLTQIGRV